MLLIFCIKYVKTVKYISCNGVLWEGSYTHMNTSNLQILISYDITQIFIKCGHI